MWCINNYVLNYAQKVDKGGEGPSPRPCCCFRSGPVGLWLVSFPIDDLHSMNPPTVEPKLGSGELLLDIFPSELNIKFIHVTVQVPARSECYMDSWYNSVHYSVIRRYR